MGGLMAAGGTNFLEKPFAGALIISAIIAVFVWLLTKELAFVEQEMFTRLMTAFHAEEAGAGASDPRSVFSNIVTIASFSVFAGLSAWAGLKLGSFARVIAGMQIFAVSLCYQFLVWQTVRIVGHPLGYAVVIALGFLGGGWLRHFNETRKISQSRYYELKIRNRELHETRLTMVKQDEVERRMLAADLHDQVLNDMKQLVQRFENYVESQDVEDLSRVRTLSTKVMHEIREVMESLCPSVLEHLGLEAALEDCLRKGAERASFKVRFRSKIESDDLKGLSLVEQSLLYRLVQESITNICKHAEASTVRIVVEKVDNDLLITINDDGKGLDPAKSRQDSRGLKYMRLRADLIGATIAWKAGDNNRGTKVEIRMDLREKVMVNTDDR